MKVAYLPHITETHTGSGLGDKLRGSQGKRGKKGGGKEEEKEEGRGFPLRKYNALLFQQGLSQGSPISGEVSL